MKLVDRAAEIFAKIEPGLIAFAKAKNIHDPVGEARSWYFRFFAILQGFDSGRYKCRKDDDEGNPINYNPDEDPLENERFISSLSGYLKCAFNNDVRYSMKRTNRLFLIPDYEKFDVAYSPTAVSGFDEEDVILLSDMLAVISGDIRRSSRIATVSRDDINNLFLTAILNYYSKSLQTMGDFPIVANYHATQPRDFFIIDIRDSRVESIAEELRILVSKSGSRILELASKKLLDSDNKYGALGKRISRYFNSFQGGMPARLKEIKERRHKSAYVSK